MPEAKKVMIVDDEQDAIDILESVLEDVEGVETVAAKDGASALATLKETKIDLVLLDVQMPGKSGFDVFSAIRDDVSIKDTPVMMITGVRERTGLAFSATEMGEFFGKEPEGYFEKPIDPEEVQRKVSEVLGL